MTTRHGEPSGAHATPSASGAGWTAGPWLLKFDPPTMEDDFPYMRLGAGQGKFFIDRGEHEGESEGFYFTCIMAEPDARLIAAAPDLAEALQLAVALYDAENPPLSKQRPGSFLIHPRWVTKARAALARISGAEPG